MFPAQSVLGSQSRATTVYVADTSNNLIRRGQPASSAPIPVISLHPTQGQGITLTLDEVLLHSVCRLLQAAVTKSDWDMELKLPGVEAGPLEQMEPRTIN